MATKLQIIYDVKEHLNKYSDDNEYSDRHILYLYDLKRAKFLRQLLDDKTRNIDKILVQTLCLKFEEINKGLCGVNVGCDTVLRSINPLPQFLQVRNRNMLLTVTPSVILSKSFKIVDIESAPYILDKPYSNGVYATIDNEGYVIIFSKQEEFKLIECLTVSAVFENPLELENFSNCCNCDTTPQSSCYSDDSLYPAPSFIIDLCRDEIIKLFTLKEQVKEDKNNNSDND